MILQPVRTSTKVREIYDEIINQELEYLRDEVAIDKYIRLSLEQQVEFYKKQADVANEERQKSREIIKSLYLVTDSLRDFINTNMSEVTKKENVLQR